MMWARAIGFGTMLLAAAATLGCSDSGSTAPIAARNALVFAQGNFVHVLGTDGAALHDSMDVGFPIYRVTPSPDGRRLAVEPQENWRVWVSDVGTHSVHMLHTSIYCGDIAWSPDGNRLVCENPDDSLRLWTMNADGSNARRIPGLDSAITVEPAWSPDGQWIVYVQGTDSRALWVMHSDGSARHVLPIDASITTVQDPAWSPDGREIAFAGVDEFNRSGIFVVNADGSSLHRVTNATNYPGHPTWRADGNEIAWYDYYMSDTPHEAPGWRLYHANAHGGDPAIFGSYTASGQISPVWKPLPLELMN